MCAVHTWLRAFRQRVYQCRALPDRLFHRRTERADQPLSFYNFSVVRERCHLDVASTRYAHAHTRAVEDRGELGHERSGRFCEALVRLESSQQIEDTRG